MEGKLDLKLNVVDENGCELTDKKPYLYQTTDTVRYVTKQQLSAIAKDVRTTFVNLIKDPYPVVQLPLLL